MIKKQVDYTGVQIGKNTQLHYKFENECDVFTVCYGQTIKGKYIYTMKNNLGEKFIISRTQTIELLNNGTLTVKDFKMKKPEGLTGEEELREVLASLPKKSIEEFAEALLKGLLEHEWEGVEDEA